MLSGLALFILILIATGVAEKWGILAWMWGMVVILFVNKIREPDGEIKLLRKEALEILSTEFSISDDEIEKLWVDGFKNNVVVELYDSRKYIMPIRNDKVCSKLIKV